MSEQIQGRINNITHMLKYEDARLNIGIETFIYNHNLKIIKYMNQKKKTLLICVRIIHLLRKMNQMVKVNEVGINTLCYKSVYQKHRRTAHSAEYLVKKL